MPAAGGHYSFVASPLIGPSARPTASSAGSIPDFHKSSQVEARHFRNDLQDFTQELEGVSEDLRARNRLRKRRLLSLKEASPRAARPGLALVRGLDAAYAGDLEQVEKELLKCCQALGVGR